VEKTQEPTTPTRAFLPTTDIFETEDALTVVLEMPGVDRENIDVNVESGVLTVEGRISMSKYEGLQPVYSEYNIGPFRRTFRISSGIDQDKIKAFFEAHPESTRQNAWLTSHPVPASYAGVDYFGVHAFTFTNAAGETKLVKYKAIPEAGDLGLTPDEAKAKGPDFYAPELKDRLGKGAVAFDLVAILGEKGDQTSDPTLRWNDEDNRATAPLGKITINAIAPDATCNAFSFLPGNVADGIAGPTDDPVFAARSPAYAVSLIRRLTPAQ